ncbi:MAG: DUF3578 domain-containing protein [Caldisericota bacterium]|nr:DUF3578 domain-containing protein [Caldisericota bacterium]
MLKEGFLKVLNEYQVASKEPIAKHPIATLLRKDIPEYLVSLLENPDEYKVEGSAGKGRWAKCPWVATIDINITTTPKRGYYIVYLFRENMNGIYLSLMQGAAEMKEMHEEHLEKVLKNRATTYINKIGGVPKMFPETKIDLETKSHSELASFYEMGNIFAKYYSVKTLNSYTEKQLIEEFRQMIKLYDFLVHSKTTPSLFTNVEKPVKKTQQKTTEKKQTLFERIKEFIQKVIRS